MRTLVSVGLWLVVGLGSGTASATERPDVVLITLDTTRADRLGCYGHEAAHTPHLDALASRGRRYDRAYSPAPLTIPAHAALFTGRTPASLGLTRNDGGLTDEATTLAERFQQAGYHTIASTAASVTSSVWGFGQGFDEYHDDLSMSPIGPAQRPGSQVVDDVLDRDVDGAPRFVWVHLFDAHDPELHRPGSTYDDAVSELDQQVGRLVAAFSSRPTLFVIAGDHGEGLGDHDERTHGMFIYEATQRVPLIVHGPGIGPEVVSEPMSLIDLAPTLLHHLDLTPLPDAEGRVSPGTPPSPVVLEAWALTHRFNLAPHRGVVVGAHKFIDLPTPELYDVVSDPGELRNLARLHPERVEEMRAMLPPARLPSPTRASGDVQLLSSLGYLEPSTGGSASGDPKDHRFLWLALEHADAHVSVGAIDRAIRHLGGVLEKHPDVKEVSVRLAQLLTDDSRAVEAEAVLRDGLVRDPGSVLLKEALVDLHLRSYRFGEAALILEDLARDHPGLPGIHWRAMDALSRTPGSESRALKLGLARMRQAADPQVAGRVGVLYARAGRMDLATPLLELGATAKPPPRDLHWLLARIADQRGDPDRAIQLLQLEVEHHPNNPMGGLALALLLERESRFTEQLAACEAVLGRVDEARIHSTVPSDLRSNQGLGLLWALKARALMSLGRSEEALQAVHAGLNQEDHPALRELRANLLGGP